MAVRDVPEDFQRKLDAFNDDMGGPTKIAVLWNEKTKRWVLWAVPVQDSHHPDYHPAALRQLCRPLPDESGREGVLLMSWADRDHLGNDIGYRPLDDRIFHTLRWADSFQSRNHFEEATRQAEFKKEMEIKDAVRETAYAAKNYWYAMDKLSIAPHIKGGGDWRWRYR